MGLVLRPALTATVPPAPGAGFGDVYAAFNAHSFEVSVRLPAPPAGRRWCRLVDTNLPPPRDYTPGGNAGVEATYGIAPNSSIVLLTKPAEA